jgi:hypothetical protein
MMLALVLSLPRLTALSAPFFDFPTIDYSRINSRDPGAPFEVASHLLSLGGFQISGIPYFGDARQVALGRLADCLLFDSMALETRVNDGRKRLSTGAATIGGVPQPMSSNCGDASLPLRQIVAAVALQVASLLDLVSVDSPMRPRQSFRDLVEHGGHLEHLHAYYDSPTPSDQQGDSFSLPLHTDSGLFIAMTYGLHSTPGSGSSLFLQLPSEQTVQVAPSPDSLIIMVGQGGADWLSPVLGAPLRALPHALVLDLPSGGTRSWFGKMLLPPADALLPRHYGVNVSFQSYREKEIAASVLSAPELLPSACGRRFLPLPSSAPPNRFLRLAEEPLCSEGDEVMCWQHCYAVSDSPCGDEAQCVDTTTGSPTAGDVSCPTCLLQCPSSLPDHIRPAFCWGKGVDMYMAGFTSLLLEEAGSVPCLNLFFKSWTLSDGTRFTLACLGVALLGLVIEVLSAVRRRIFSDLPPSHSRNALLVLLHSAQTGLAYFLMLAAMTFSAELFAMVLVGIGVGHFFFNLQEPPHDTDPCCPQFSETELTETETNPEPPDPKAYGTHGTYQKLSMTQT